MLHQPTLVAGQVIITVIFAVIFYAIHWVYPKLDGTLYAVAGFAVASIARIFFMGSSETVMVLGNVFALVASGLFYMATLRHLRIYKPARSIWVLTGSLVLLVLLCTAFKVSHVASVLCHSGAFFLIRALWSRDLFRRASGRPIIMAFAIFMAIYAVFAMNLFSTLIPGMEESSSRNLQIPSNITISLVNVALSVMLGLFMLLMMADTIKASEKLAAANLLANSIAHEINNPLQSVTNLLFILQNHSEQGESSILLQEAQSELARVTYVVTQTLRFHRQSDKDGPYSSG